MQEFSTNLAINLCSIHLFYLHSFRISNTLAFLLVNFSTSKQQNFNWRSLLHSTAQVVVIYTIHKEVGRILLQSHQVLAMVLKEVHLQPACPVVNHMALYTNQLLLEREVALFSLIKGQEVGARCEYVLAINSFLTVY